jgi:hypothetical protein
MKIRKGISSGILYAALAAGMLAGCSKDQGSAQQTSSSAPAADPDQAKKVEFLNDISGVWKPDDSNLGLWTFYYADNKLTSVLANTLLPVSVEDVDLANGTVNLNLLGADGSHNIITIRQVWDTAHTTFTLAATLWNGRQASLGFVRAVSSDDLDQIAQLEAESQPQAGQSTPVPAASAAQVAPPDTAGPASAAPAPAVPPVAPAAQASDGAGADATVPNAQGATYQTSFDCGAAGTLPQYLICHDPALAASDRNLAVVLQQARTAVQDQQAFADRIRKQWNYRETHCKDVSCLTAWYQYETGTLTKIVQTGDVNAQ